MVPDVEFSLFSGFSCRGLRVLKYKTENFDMFAMKGSRIINSVLNAKDWVEFFFK